MEYNYINSICEAYFNDHHLYDKNIYKTIDDGIITLQDEIKSVVFNLRLEDVDLYYDLVAHDKTDQQRIIYHLLDNYMESQFPELEKDNQSEEINEIIGEAAAFIGLFVVAILTLKQVSAIKHTIQTIIYSLTDGLANFIKKHIAVSGKVKHAILVTHLDKCSAKCGLGTTNAKKQLAYTISLAIRSDLFTASRKAEEQGKCLVACYLDYIIGQIRVLADSYISCLKSTGELPDDLSSFSILHAQPSGERCRVFYDVLKKSESDFEEAVDYIFEKDPRERQNWMNKFNTAIIESMRIDSGSRQSFRPNNQGDRKQNNNQNFRDRSKQDRRF
jgi:hypothetical protein